MDRPNAPTGSDESSWVPSGIASGLVGAAVIAVFFLVIDVAQGRPFWTPGALGSALFLGESLASGETPQPVIVTAYTVMHGGVFVSLGLIAAYAMLGTRRRLGAAAALAIAAALFVGCELIFLVFAGLLAPDVASELTRARIAVANLLAALAMSAALVWNPRTVRSLAATRRAPS